MFDPNFKFLRLKIKSLNLRAMPALMTQLITLIKQLSAYILSSIFLICCSGWVWESFPTNKVSVEILSRLGDFGLRLTGLLGRSMSFHQITLPPGDRACSGELF